VIRSVLDPIEYPKFGSACPNAEVSCSFDSACVFVRRCLYHNSLSDITTPVHCFDDLPIRPLHYSISLPQPSLLQPVIRLDQAEPLSSAVCKQFLGRASAPGRLRVCPCLMPHDPSRQSTIFSIHPPVRFIVEFVYVICSLTYGVKAGLHTGEGNIPFHDNDAIRELLQYTFFATLLLRNKKNRYSSPNVFFTPQSP
jgi:hypothetical protein